MSINPWFKPNQHLKSAKSGRLASPSDLHFPHVLQTHHYVIKTLEDATQLAGYLSSFYPQNRSNIELGLNEILINAIEHGNLGITYEEKRELKKHNIWYQEIQSRLNKKEHSPKQVEVRFEHTPDYILVIVKDQGSGFNWRQYDITSRFAKHTLNGRGLLVAKELSFDNVTFSENGNEVWCVVYL